MIDAVMYGMMPRPKIVDCCRLPPEKIDAYSRMRPKPEAPPSVARSAASRRAVWSTPSSGITNPTR